MMKTYLITGAGFLGKQLVGLLGKQDNHKIRVFDNNESALSEVRSATLRTLYGDIRDYERVLFAMRGVDTCIHTAAMRNIDITEYNLPELIKTNILGTMNMVQAAMALKIPKFIYVSSDKAVNPSSSYGVTKLMGEEIIKWASSIQEDVKFSIVRPGNFIRDFKEVSSGNFIEIWNKQKDKGDKITLTHKDMKRWFIEVDKITELILRIEQEMNGGEIFIPKMGEYGILELARQWAGSEDNIKIIGLRKGEKITEELWTQLESLDLKEKDDYFVIGNK